MARNPRGGRIELVEGKKVIRGDDGKIRQFDPRTQHEVVWRSWPKGGSLTYFGKLTPVCTLEDGDRVYFQTAANDEIASAVGLPPDPKTKPRTKDRRLPPRFGGQVLLTRSM